MPVEKVEPHWGGGQTIANITQYIRKIFKRLFFKNIQPEKQ